MITSGQSNLTRGRIAAADASFNGIRCAAMCTTPNAWFLGPTGVRPRVSPKEKSQLHKISPFLFPPPFPFLSFPLFSPLLSFVPSSFLPSLFLPFPSRFLSYPFSPSLPSPKSSQEAWGALLAPTDRGAVRTAEIRTGTAHSV